MQPVEPKPSSLKSFTQSTGSSTPVSGLQNVPVVASKQVSGSPGQRPVAVPPVVVAVPPVSVLVPPVAVVPPVPPVPPLLEPPRMEPLPAVAPSSSLVDLLEQAPAVPSTTSKHKPTEVRSIRDTLLSDNRLTRPHAARQLEFPVLWRKRARQLPFRTISR